MDFTGAVMKRSRKLWALGAAAVALWSATHTAAVAQDSMGDVVVVAQRRSENLQDVPISVSAMRGEEIASILQAGGDVLALAGQVPGLNIESSNGRVAPRFYIRGLGNTDFDLAASQPVSVLFDDVVQENVALKSFPIFDVDQVEVLRGPQGTLYGRNTPAGIIHFRSNRPSQDFEAVGGVSYGTYGTATLDGAVGGGITSTLSGRASVLVQRRDDWIDNAFTGQNDVMGGYEEYAARFQLLFEPTDNLSILANVHGRSLEGTSTLFRANVFTTGSNELNGNFDRDTVFFNQGSNNPQEYDGFGGSLTVEWDLGGAALTSITAYESADGRSLGDIDGGVAGVGPGFIPFDAETQDSLDDLDQVTQEFRLASPDEGRFNWQIGAFYFDSEFQVTTVGPAGFPPSTTLVHENTSWAVFGQASYDLTERLTVTGGVRYTDDEKDLRAVAAPIPVTPVSVSDSQVSWDLSAVYAATENVNLFARVASGFRAPSIQGRDVAFFNPPSVAQSETITSFEAGLKSLLLDNTVRFNATAYYYTIEDQQFTAIGGAANLTQLVNADEGEGYGIEAEFEAAVTDNLTVSLGAAWNHTEIQDSNLRVAPCGSGQCTVLDPVVGGFALVDGNPFPQAPEYTLDLGASYRRPVGDGGEFFVETDWTVRGETNIFLYDAVEYRIDAQAEGALRVGYGRADGAWEVSVFARNITDAENVIGGIDFNNNTGFVNEPRIIGVSLRARR